MREAGWLRAVQEVQGGFGARLAGAVDGIGSRDVRQFVDVIAP